MVDNSSVTYSFHKIIFVCVVLFFFIYSLYKHLLYHLISQNNGFQETATHEKNTNGLELTVLTMFVCLAERYRRKW